MESESSKRTSEHFVLVIFAMVMPEQHDPVKAWDVWMSEIDVQIHSDPIL